MNEEIVTKRRVTMRSIAYGPDGQKIEHVAVDFVRPDFLDAYVADASNRWQHVSVSSEPDAGPGGYHGETVVPANISHPLAGRVFPATEPEGDDR